MEQKKIVVLGSTGSIGINTLKVVERYPKLFKIVGLSAYNNIELIENQVKRFAPKYVAVRRENHDYLRRRIPSRVKILDVDKDLASLVALKEVDCIVIAMRGAAALLPFLSAVRHGKTVCPANKEAIVIAGDILMREAKRFGANIIPIDSEQSAIFQCLEGQDKKGLHKIHLTASGGPLLNVAQNRFSRLKVEDILNHPRWKMGKKITVDSATLMNKGFEVIEAKYLFDVDVDKINVVVHPQAIIHSMVEFKDGSIMAQLAITDMRLPIQYALTYPKRLEVGLNRIDFVELKHLDFQKPDFKKFPALKLAIFAGKKQGTVPAVLNAADEEAVDAFLNKKIRFDEIYPMVERIVLKHKSTHQPSLRQILEADDWARSEARKVIERTV